MGGFSQTWSTAATVRAAIWPISATEQKRAAAPTMTITHQVRIRYYANLRGDWRIKFGSRYFSVVSIINTNEKNEILDIMCKEVF
jgi:SPP1 family predicted phage head-tail adaptor